MTRHLANTGCPSVPVIRGETAGSQAYSYDVVWSVQSDYSLLQHEVSSWSDLTQSNALPRLCTGLCPLTALPQPRRTPGGCPQPWPPGEILERRVRCEVSLIRVGLSPDQTVRVSKWDREEDLWNIFIFSSFEFFLTLLHLHINLFKRQNRNQR